MSSEQPALPINTALPARLSDWARAGWLRGVDHALACFLNEEGGEQDETVLLMAPLTSQQVGQGNICLDLQQALSEPTRLWPELPDTGVAEAIDRPTDWLGKQEMETLTAVLTQSAVIACPAQQRDQGNEPLVLQGNRLYLRRYWQHEQDVAASIEARLETEETVAPNLKSQLDALFAGGAYQPDWQKVASALAVRSALTIITGGPGTGKTTTVVKLLGLLQARQLTADPERPLRIRLAAPTGKAAARLSESIGGAIDALPFDESVKLAVPREVRTLHRLLGSVRNSRFFRNDRHNPLHADVVVIDEASMIDLEMTAKLLDALRPETRLILLGDKDQLASVEAGAVLGDLCQGADAGDYSADTVDWVKSASGEEIGAFQARDQAPALRQHTVMLRHSHRFSADSGIGGLAAAVNAGDSERTLSLLGEGDDDVSLALLKDAEDSRIEKLSVAGYRPYLEQLKASRPDSNQEPDPDKATRDWARKVIHHFGQFQVLATVRQGMLGVSGLNERIAAVLRREGLIDKDRDWYEGRPVMVTRNDYELGLMNGDVGICLLTRLADDERPRLRVAFELPGGDIRLVLPSRLDSMESVFAMTVHKSQGSEFDRVLMVLPEVDNPVLTRELLYTGITRARHQATLAGTSEHLIRLAVARRISRRSGLRERLNA